MAEFKGADTLRCPATLDNLAEFQSFVQIRAEMLGLPAELKNTLALVMEELAVNVMHYAYPDGQGKLEVHCLRNKDGLQRFFCVQLMDWGKPFNPLTGESSNTNLSIEERPVGGLGIFLAREMADTIDYERDGDSNVLTFCFTLPGS